MYSKRLFIKLGFNLDLSFHSHISVMLWAWTNKRRNLHPKRWLTQMPLQLHNSNSTFYLTSPAAALYPWGQIQSLVSLVWQYFSGSSTKGKTGISRLSTIPPFSTVFESWLTVWQKDVSFQNYMFLKKMFNILAICLNCMNEFCILPNKFTY